MCKSKNDGSKEIESLDFRGLTEIEMQEFEERIDLDEEFRRFVLEDRSTGKSRLGYKGEGIRLSEIDTEDSYRILMEEQSYAEY